jgi:hypothetical protein
MTVNAARPLSRRALVAGTLGAAAATVVGAVTRPFPAAAVTESATYTNNENDSVVITGQSVHQVGFDESGKGIGVYGFSTSYRGVFGYSPSGTGVVASGGLMGVDAASDSGHGVDAFANTGVGVSAHSNSGTAVSGASDSGTGVYGSSFSGTTGVQGHANASNGATYGVQGDSNSTAGTGVLGFAAAATGATWGVSGLAASTHGTGGLGWSTARSTGLMGYSSDGLGSPPPAALPNTGVYGTAPLTGGRGGQFSGQAAQVRLRPSSATSHPASGQRGDLFVDKAGRLWFCKGGANWVKLA